jgi:hypothetical protein
MNRKGTELSINFLIGTILGIVLLILGFSIAFRLLVPPPFVPEDDFRTTCAQTGEKVCIAPTRIEGQVNKVSIYELVINNIYGDARSFKPYVVFAMGKTEDGSIISSDLIDSREWTFEEFPTKLLENTKDVKVEIPIRPPRGTKPGTYTFNVNVCFDGNTGDDAKCSFPEKSLYSPTQQITITVT